MEEKRASLVEDINAVPQDHVGPTDLRTGYIHHCLVKLSGLLVTELRLLYSQGKILVLHSGYSSKDAVHLLRLLMRYVPTPLNQGKSILSWQINSFVSKTN
ncbi:uncharacterized protein ALTATR162_LOCUS2787 [Alternaria atra]|uniref:Uncharacterized protein n=1 Tax=Alternaria atra TaxID=119953 RepID=A0A8J2HZA8_9PLEO|nr:uncharacterized protein ALTATR162_LOCUS2787 [Alternaria atra]CAG5152479.1 unnamed protein product [Alternaria atra]